MERWSYRHESNSDIGKRPLKCGITHCHRHLD
jgi:hypothetical protein